MTGCEVSAPSNDGYGIYLGGVGHTSLKDCVIRGKNGGICVENSGEASFVLKDSLVKGGIEYGVNIQSVGTGTFEVSGNRFENAGNYAVWVYLPGLKSGNELKGIHGNSYSGSQIVNGVVLNGYVSQELNVPTGEYVFNGVGVQNTGVLNVEQGTMVCFENGKSFFTYGEVNLLGMEEAPIVFTVLGDEEYGAGLPGTKYTSWGGIRVCEGGTLNAEHTKFLNYEGTRWDYGLYCGILSQGTLNLTGCEVGAPDNNGYGIYLEEAEDTSIKDCVLDGKNNGIYVSCTSDASFLLEDSVISGAVSGGLYIQSIGTGTFSIAHNTFKDCGYYPIHMNLAYLYSFQTYENNQ